MNQVDDVTFAQVKGSTLMLGGRKISSRQYRGIRVEDVAAIWQSEKNREGHGSGFSLDPSYDYRGLENSLAKAEPALRSLRADGALAVSEKDIQSVKVGLSKKDIVPYLTLVEKLQKKIEKLRLGEVGTAQDVNEFLRSPRTDGFQAARYDGDLQGTEVGMVLFYTDLLAKLWALDYLNTTPEKHISDFKPLTKVTVSSIYEQELKELPNTRLWFGTQDKGFQVADGGDSIFFARNTTRIYAASSNPLRPGAETTASATSEAFLGWWNDHYEEVARYEPQYERLNQIMKWSLLISWLNKANKGETLEFLQGVQVKRENWFPDWVRANSEQLKFQRWDRVSFYERGNKGAKTEAMPILVSQPFKEFGKEHYLYGGVSLASKDLLEARTALPATSEVSELGLRSNLKYDAVASVDNSLNLNTLEGTTYKLKNLEPELSSVTAKAKDGVKFRSPESELTNLEFSRNISRTDSGIEIKTSVGGTELGSFSTVKTGNGFSVGWRSMDINRGQALALEVSQTSKDVGTVLRGHPDVESLVKLGTEPPPKYLVKMHGSNRWLKLVQQEKGSANIPPGWQSRVSGFGEDSHNTLLAWENDEAVTKQLADGSAECIRCDSPKGESSNGTFDDNLWNKPYEAICDKLRLYGSCQEVLARIPEEKLVRASLLFRKGCNN